ncbi:MAG: FtsX-like permease family protein [Candidatus Hermodarchaeota archaeon]
MAKSASHGPFSKGSRFYSLSYALSAMKSNPFRSLSLALTLALGISLLTSNIVWTDTGVKVSVDTYLENNAFQLLVKTYDEHSIQGALAFEYLQEDPLVDTVMRPDSTLGFLWGTDFPDDFEYDVDDSLYSAGVKDCRIILVNNDFLNLASVDFRYDGSFELYDGEVLVSSQFVAYTEEVFNLTLSIGDTIDLELLGRDEPAQVVANPLEIGNLDRYSIENLRIAGIYHPQGYNTLIEQAFPSYMRASWNYTNVRFPVLGLRDSVMILDTSIPTGYLDAEGWFPAHSLVRTDADGLLEDGPSRISRSIRALATRVEQQYYVDADGLDQADYIQRRVNSYLNSVSYSMLNLPIFLLALVLSIFAADTFMAPRSTEVGVLRSKGASSSQVYGIFLWETFFLAMLSLVLGVFLATVFAALIPATTSFMTFDWSVYEFYLLNSVVRVDTLIAAVVLCIIPPMLFILYLSKKAAQAEIGSMLEDSLEKSYSGEVAYRFTLGASVVLLAIVLFGALYFPRNPLILLFNLALATAAWFFIAYNGSRVSRLGLAGISSRLSNVLGQKNRITAAYLRMRRGRIIPLMLVLALTISTTIAFSVQAESLRYDLEREVDYAVGADMRIETDSLPFAFSDTLEAYDQVSSVTPVYRALGRIGSDELAVTALDASKYSLIGHFDETSFPDASAEEVLSDLSNLENGVVISAYHAQRWNKVIGDLVRIAVSGIGITREIYFNITGIVYSAPGFGYSWKGDVPPSRLGAGFGFQSDYEGFMLTNIDFVSTELGKSETDLFIASLEEDTDLAAFAESLMTDSSVDVFTPETLNLKTQSYGTALFLNTIEGLFSIGFVMGLVMSLFALSLFLGSVVRERRKEYAVLRALGGSRRQLVTMVFSEFSGVVLASLAVSLVLGTALAYVNGFFLFQMSPFSRTLPATIAIPMNFLLLVLVIEIIAMIIGAYFPAREAGKTDPAIVLRNL